MANIFLNPYIKISQYNEIDLWFFATDSSGSSIETPGYTAAFYAMKLPVKTWDGTYDISLGQFYHDPSNGAFQFKMSEIDSSVYGEYDYDIVLDSSQYIVTGLSNRLSITESNYRPPWATI